MFYYKTPFLRLIIEGEEEGRSVPQLNIQLPPNYLRNYKRSHGYLEGELPQPQDQ